GVVTENPGDVTCGQSANVAGLVEEVTSTLELAGDKGIVGADHDSIGTEAVSEQSQVFGVENQRVHPQRLEQRVEVRWIHLVPNLSAETQSRVDPSKCSTSVSQKDTQ